ncbi:MAG: hypothetical protein NVS3B5_08150 [Sphingomicrobium sp.]
MDGIMFGMFMVLAAGAALASNSPATMDELLKATVQYCDLNLNTREGVGASARRCEGAGAAEVCQSGLPACPQRVKQQTQ